MLSEIDNKAEFVSKYCTKITSEEFANYSFRAYEIPIARIKDKYILLYNERETYFMQMFNNYRDDIEIFITNYHKLLTPKNYKLLKDIIQ